MEILREQFRKRPCRFPYMDIMHIVSSDRLRPRRIGRKRDGE